MIADLNQQLADKRLEVEQLRENLARMGVQVETLTERGRPAKRRSRTSVPKKVELRTNSIPYIISSDPKGAARCADHQQAGFIGRTLTVGTTANLDSFTLPTRGC